jgi:hypothetical protein
MSRKKRALFPELIEIFRFPVRVTSGHSSARGSAILSLKTATLCGFRFFSDLAIYLICDGLEDTVNEVRESFSTDSDSAMARALVSCSYR